METLGLVGFALLVANLAAHLANVVVCARTSAARAAIALVLPPVAATWAWEAGARRRVVFYGVTLAAFATVVVVLTHTR